MTFIRVQASLQRDGLNPIDDIVNTFHFDSDQSFADDADDCMARVDAFYDAIGGTFFHSRMAGTGVMKVYDLEDAEPRPPRIEDPFAHPVSANNAVIPGEVAVAVSYRALPIPGVSNRRLRGRLYLGLVSATMLELLSDGVHVTSACRTLLVDALVDLCTGPDAGDGRLAVFSRTIAGPAPWTATELGNAFHDVEEVWCDDAVDTIRSRGLAPTVRTTALVP